MRFFGELERYRAKGELLYRIHKSQARLESSPYTPEECGKKDNLDYDWPADWIGRALLGNVIISEASGSESVYEDELICTVVENLNGNDYMGKIQPNGIVDEQQLSGHNWLLRGLLEYSAKPGKDNYFDIGIKLCADDAMEMADSIVKNLYLPIAKYYENYPVNPNERVYSGEKSGTLTGKVVNNWKISSDTGCAFMCLDGLADYYSISKAPAVGKMLDIIIEKFVKIDFTGIQMQTHASLSATRGILKYYKATQRQDLLDFAIKFAQMYIDYGMTANYANYNWFCRPTWTEPCAVIDSFMLFSDLFFITDDIKYIRVARRIYKNAIRFGQRNNGGFGTDKCADVSQPILRPDGDLDKLNEAFWCCTMRGGEGLGRVLQYNVAEDDKTIVLTALSDGQYRCKDFIISFVYEEGPKSFYRINVENKGDFKKDLLIYLPKGAKNVLAYSGDNFFETEIKDGFVVIPSSIINECDGLAKMFIFFDLNIAVEDAVGIFANGENANSENANTGKKGHVVFIGDDIIGLPEDKTEGYEGIPEFEIQDNNIVDKKSGLEAVYIGKNIDCQRDDKLYNQSIRIVF